MNNFDYTRADDPERALQAATGPRVRFLAGGTDLLPLLKEGIISPDALVDISGWSGGAGIELQEVGSVTIGALTPLAALAKHSDIKAKYSALADACRLAATPQLRNMGTLGGNLLQQTRCWYYRGPHDCWMKGGKWCFARDGENENHAIFLTRPGESNCVSAHPSDPGAALLALDATVQIRKSGGESNVPIAEFFALPTENRRTYTNLADGALITAIKLAPYSPARRSSYVKAMARASWAFALAGVALSVVVEDGRIEQTRVALAGVAPIPFRVSEVETELDGCSVDVVDFDKLGNLLVSQAVPLEHNGYKVDLLRGLFKQALTDILK